MKTSLKCINIKKVVWISCILIVCLLTFFLNFQGIQNQHIQYNIIEITPYIYNVRIYANDDSLILNEKVDSTASPYVSQINRDLLVYVTNAGNVRRFLFVNTSNGDIDIQYDVLAYSDKRMLYPAIEGENTVVILKKLFDNTEAFFFLDDIEQNIIPSMSVLDAKIILNKFYVIRYVSEMNSIEKMKIVFIND